jgi:hypothetical protein
LVAAQQQLENLNKNKDTEKFIVFFTDGKIDVEHQKYTTRTNKQSEADVYNVIELINYPIYTIGLNPQSNIDKKLLDDISILSGAGEPLITPNPKNLIGFYNEIFADLTGEKIEYKDRKLVGNKEIDVFTIPVPDFVSEINITITSLKPLNGFNVINSNGIDLNENKNVQITKSNHYSVIKIINPDKGDISLSIDGKMGENVNIAVVKLFEGKIVTKIQPDTKTKILNLNFFKRINTFNKAYAGKKANIRADIITSIETKTSKEDITKSFNSVKLILNSVDIGNMKNNGDHFVMEYIFDKVGENNLEIIATNDEFGKKSFITFEVIKPAPDTIIYLIFTVFIIFVLFILAILIEFIYRFINGYGKMIETGQIKFTFSGDNNYEISKTKDIKSFKNGFSLYDLIIIDTKDNVALNYLTNVKNIKISLKIKTDKLTRNEAWTMIIKKSFFIFRCFGKTIYQLTDGNEAIITNKDVQKLNNYKIKIEFSDK